MFFKTEILEEKYNLIKEKCNFMEEKYKDLKKKKEKEEQHLKFIQFLIKEKEKQFNELIKREVKD